MTIAYAIQQAEHELAFLKQRVIEKEANALQHAEHTLEYLQGRVAAKEAELAQHRSPQPAPTVATPAEAKKKAVKPPPNK